MYTVENKIDKIIDATVPSICFFSRCLGMCYSDTDIMTIGSSIFPKNPQEMMVVRLMTEVYRAYSRESMSLTMESLTSKVRMLIPWNSFHLEWELQQCAAACFAFIVNDDGSPFAALLILNCSRSLQNRYQSAFMVILTIEVLARLIKYNADLQAEFENLSYIIFNSSYNEAAKYIENSIIEIQNSKNMKAKIIQDIENAFKN